MIKSTVILWNIMILLVTSNLQIKIPSLKCFLMYLLNTWVDYYSNNKRFCH